MRRLRFYTLHGHKHSVWSPVGVRGRVPLHKTQKVNNVRPPYTRIHSIF